MVVALGLNSPHLIILYVSQLIYQYGLYLCSAFTVIDPPAVAPLSA